MFPAICSTSLDRVANDGWCTPRVFCQLVRLAVNRFLVGLFCGLIAYGRTLGLVFHGAIYFIGRAACGNVSTNVKPVVLEVYVFVDPRVIARVGRVPKAVCVYLSGTVAVVPFFRYFVVFFRVVVYRRFFGFFIYGARVFIGLYVYGYGYFRVVGSYGGAFF